MKIIFLGTGTSQGIPVINCECEVCTSMDFRDKRTRSSIYVQTDLVDLVIDTGPDFRQQMLTNRIRNIDAVLFTHAHKDHTAGLDDIRSYNFSLNKEIPIYAQEQVLEQLKQEFAYIFSEKKYPGIPQVGVNTIDNTPFEIFDEYITPIEVMHYKLPVFGYRIQDFAYITDANYISDTEKETIKNCNILVINALQKEKHISHFNLEEALQLIEEVKPKKAYLTHIGHKMGLHAEVTKELPENVEIAYDGLVLNI